MSRKSDVIVIGSGLAGLAAALAAAGSGKKVTIMTSGVGTMAVSSGCIDLLGYAQGKRVLSPLEEITSLPPEHPYRLVGKEAVARSVAWLQGVCQRYGLNLKANEDGSNHDLITVMGTLKPSYMSAQSFDTSIFDEVRRAVVITVDNMKDVHPRLIINQLHRYVQYRDMEFMEATISCPIAQAHRNITPLDIAHFVETREGEHWLIEKLTPYARLYPAILVPPVLGIQNSQALWERLCGILHTRLVEMVSIPPGVAGLRVREAMKKAMNDLSCVELVENATVCDAVTQDGRCLSVMTDNHDGERRWEADQFIIATGGILGGGLETMPGKAWESIFKIPVDAPADPQEWASMEIFGESLFSSLGVRCNASLQAIDGNGQVLLQNVRFAGRILGGYDYAAEKSGHGVALATGMQAGILASKENAS
ncbi:MAG: anaerobic glycerol-3-phosphate dehydrogenase subunit B [Mailhella sp.]|nr:anaerobic glycerol-3-phosphate dehydrogenase subunit B [Mailhella sp.]